jgi:hypothetical protein
VSTAGELQASLVLAVIIGAVFLFFTVVTLAAIWRDVQRRRYRRQYHQNQARLQTDMLETKDDAVKAEFDRLAAEL